MTWCILGSGSINVYLSIYQSDEDLAFESWLKCVLSPYWIMMKVNTVYESKRDTWDQRLSRENINNKPLSIEKNIPSYRSNKESRAFSDIQCLDLIIRDD